MGNAQHEQQARAPKEMKGNLLFDARGYPRSGEGEGAEKGWRSFKDPRLYGWFLAQIRVSRGVVYRIGERILKASLLYITHGTEALPRMGVLKTCIGGFKPAVLRSGYGFMRVSLRQATGGSGW